MHDLRETFFRGDRRVADQCADKYNTPVIRQKEAGLSTGPRNVVRGKIGFNESIHETMISGLSRDDL